VGLTLLTLGVPGISWGQQGATISGGPACVGCRIQLAPLVTLGSQTDTILQSLFSYAARDKRGWYFVAMTHTDGVVAVYDSTGSFRYTIGRKGKGPGELGAVQALLIDGDTLHVYGDRESVFLRNGRFVRANGLPSGVSGVFGGVLLPGGSTLLQAAVQTSGHAGHPFHVLAADRSVHRSFGGSTTEPYQRSAFTERRYITPAANGRFWAAELNRYRLQLWSGEGRLERELERRAEWFVPWKPEAETAQRRARKPPLARIAGLAVDEQARRIWVAVLVAGTDWQAPASRSAPAGARPTRRDWTEIQNLFDTVIEVIDLDTGRLLVSQRFPTATTQVIGPGLIVSFHEYPDGALSLRVWKAAVIIP